MKKIVEICDYDDIQCLTKYNQMIIKQNNNLLRQIPIEDIEIVIVNNPKTSYSHELIIKLIENKSIIILCDEKHIPTTLVCCVENHSLYAERLHMQIKMDNSVKDMAWRQLLREKINNQKSNLTDVIVKDKIDILSNNIQNMDETNIEAQVARIYWHNWIPVKYNFKRNRKGSAPNNLLNYGYAILRTLILRGIMISGLNPTIGIKHCSKKNPYCLADDLMEPYRPVVDKIVRKMFLYDGINEVNKEFKKSILSLPTKDFYINNELITFSTAINKMVESYVDIIYDRNNKIIFPRERT